MSTDERKPCRNALCDFTTSSGAAYCCDGCARADENGYEIHESGLLGHNAACRRLTVGVPHPEPATEQAIECGYCGHWHCADELCLTRNRHLDCDCPGGKLRPAKPLLRSRPDVSRLAATVPVGECICRGGTVNPVCWEHGGVPQEQAPTDE